MAEIKAFKAYLYAENLKSEMNELISPPYDVIKDAERKDMIKKNEHHSVRISLVDNPQDPDAYQKTADLYESWKSKKVLVQAQEPGLYLMQDEYELEGKTKTRLGFVALLKVSPFEEKKVFPHEHTLAGPKKDRLALLKTMGAEASQIFMAYDDKALVLEKIFEQIKNQEPRIEARDASGIKRKMWLVTDQASVGSIQDLIHTQDLLIADGHHRYETALHYHKEDQTPRTEYVQAYFTNTASPGFEILPIHRVTSLPEGTNVESFIEKLKTIYEIEAINEDEIEKQLASRNTSELTYVCSFGATNSHFLMRRKKESDTEAELFDLQNKIFENIYGWDVSKISKGNVDFENNFKNYLEAVKTRKNSVGFFLPPTDLQVVMKVVHEGERMPQKSTFFYPKLASGLVIYELGNG